MFDYSKCKIGEQRDERNALLETRSHPKKLQSGHDSLLFFGHAQERVRREREGEDRERETQRERGQREDSERDRKWWSVRDYVRGVQTKKAAAAKHVYELVYMSEKQHRERKKLTNETRDFEPMQSAALPCVSTVVNL